MTFDEILEEIFLITGRRDLVAESKSALKKSTLKAHKTDFYKKDIWEESLEFSESDFLHSLDIYTILPNFRAWKYFKRIDDTANVINPTVGNEKIGTFLEILDVDEILDSYGVNRSDIAYEAGRVLEIRASVNFTKAIIGCYLLPVVTPEEKYVSWIAEQYPQLIVHESARLIFGSIGKMEEARVETGLAAEELRELTLGAIVSVGS